MPSRPARPPRAGSADANLLAIASQAAAANPFGDERPRLDAALGGGRGDEASFEGGLGRLEGALERVLAGGLDAWPSTTRETAERALLFATFHRFAPAIDALIERQRAAGETPVPAPFVGELLAGLRACGVPGARAERWLVLFFQMRRAWVFLARDLAGRGPSMRRLRASLWNAVFTRDVVRYEVSLWNRMEDFSTLLLGETGAGKGAAAAALGRSGLIAFDPKRGAFAPSFVSTFVPVNLAELTETLLESELFGHVKGAFTGAVASRDGLFSRTRRHGAIFLDEIGELSPRVQVKLLRVLQERSFVPVGGSTTKRFEGRVIAATHQPLAGWRRDGRFRDDLFYRLCSEAVVVPPLRARLAEDPRELGELVAHLVARTLGAPSDEVAAEVEAAVARDLGPRHPWPGNVRELEQCVRSVLLTGRAASAEPLGAGGNGDDDGPTEALVDALRRGALDAETLLDRYCALLYAARGSYEAVARVTGLDRRTVKRRVLAAPTR
ncbi:MAG: sigma 54-interacting transcriptional regulator [Polyangiaceae bacterium]|jgi:transcriptional regulator with AAA-type ATPase domain|nr:sigma 54-interacting transcriptional regulator [Polyangiaceae bacterium]